MTGPMGFLRAWSAETAVAEAGVAQAARDRCSADRLRGIRPTRILEGS
ncbi:hypothetical protein [Planotetraspora kaengkrachanensis]|nr:hypothetical protein [Planotetraspora kaengkrachanensis]